MPQASAKHAFEKLLAALPRDAYTIRADYANSEKIEIQRTNGTPKVVLVWSANGLNNELTTRTEYVTKIDKWLPGFVPESSKPQYSRTFSFSASRLEEIIIENKTEIAKAILAVDQNR